MLEMSANDPYRTSNLMRSLTRIGNGEDNAMLSAFLLAVRSKVEYRYCLAVRKGSGPFLTRHWARPFLSANVLAKVVPKNVL